VGGNRSKVRRTKIGKGRKASKPLRARTATRAKQETDVARLSRELAEAFDRQTAVAEILRVISSSPGELKPVFDAMLEHATRLCRAEFGRLVLYDGSAFKTAAVFGGTPGYVRFLQENPEGAGGLIGKMRTERRAVHLIDAKAGVGYRSRNPFAVAAVELGGARSAIAVPLLKERVLIGALVLYRTRVEAFTDNQTALVQTFADQAVIAFENARLITETREALEQQTATTEVLQVINASPGDLAPVFDATLEKATRLCEAAFGILLTYDGERFHHAAMQSVPAPYAEFMGKNPQNYAPGTGPARLLAGERVVHIADAMDTEPYRSGDRHRRALVDLAGARSLVLVPLLKGDIVRGIIAIYRQEVRPFSEKQIALAQNFAAQAVIAIENARLITETREALEQQTATAEVLQVINASPGDLAPVFDAMLDKALRLCEAAFGFLATYDGHRFERGAERAVPDALAKYFRAGMDQPRPGDAHWRILAGEDLIHNLDQMDDDAYRQGSPLRRAVVDLGGARTALVVALRKEGVLLGTITIYRKEVRPFSDKQVALLRSFAAQAVIAMENVRLLGELRRRNSDLAEALEYQTATSDVLRIVASSPDDLQPVFDAMLDKAAALCEAHFGFLGLYDGMAYTFVAGKNLPVELERIWRASPQRPGPHTALQQLVETRAPVHIEDVRNDIAYLEREPLRVAAVELGRARAQLGIPLLKRGELVGAFIIYRQEPRRFTDNQIALVTNFADQAVIAIENARLLGELRSRNSELAESLEQQTATAEVLHVISCSPGDLKSVFQAVLENATRICNAKFGVLQLYEDGGFRIGAIHKPPPAFAEAMARREPLMRPTPQHPFRRMVTTKAVVQIADLTESPAYKERDPGIVMLVEHASARTFLAVPMLKENEVAGVIAIYRQEARPFTDKQIAVVVNFANQAVIAIENARLLVELRQRTTDLARSVDELTATGNVLKLISQSGTELGPVLDRVLETAARLCRVESGFIFRFQDGLCHMAASLGISEAWRNFQMRNPIAPSRGTVAGRVMLERRPVQIEDAAADPEYTRVQTLQLGHQRTLIGVPLLREDVLVGVIALARARVEPFTPRELELVATFADQAVIAIENARLLSELRTRSAELARSVDELTTLREVGQAVSSTLDLATVLETIVKRAVALAGAEAGAIYRYRKSDRQFRLGTSFGLDEALVAKIRQAPIREAETMSLARAINERAPAQIPDLETVPHLPLRDVMVAAGFRAALQVPLVGPDRVFGVLSIQKKSVGEFPESTVKLMQTFASQSVLAIQNARLFREVEEQGRALALASQHKSQFLANMSHELRTPLNAVLGYAELLADGIYGELGEKARGVLERIQSNGKHLLGLINDVLDLSKIEAGQLTLAIEDYAMPAVVHSVVSATESLAKAKGLALTSSVPKDLPLARGDERRLTQVLLNLVGNAIKFTDAGSVGISVAFAHDRFDIAVSDTGPGIAEADRVRIFEEFQQVDSSSTRKKGGTGLGLSISKRIVEMHGGAITLDSELGKGSTFHVVIPVQVAPAKEVA
jgi:GAF domain-containing protein